MNRYVDVKLILTNHAHVQYCERVEKIERDELEEECQDHLSNGNYGYNKDFFIHLDGVWWVYEIRDSAMLLLTCYGRTTMNIPKALKWARCQNDRIDLSNLVLPGAMAN